jgi:cytochrome oxidase Cu insertion factor (SCO1/SenC/PrrC family)
MPRLPHWSSLAATAFIVAGVVGAIAVGYLDSGDPLNDFGAVPDFELVERSGQLVTLNSLKGEVWIANLIFTHCAGTCPLMTAHMRALKDTLTEEEVRFVSITVDPHRDTPEVLAEYADLHGADPSWFFLTGDRNSIYRLAQEGFHLAVDDTIGTQIEPITHSTRFVLVDREGRIRNYYDGTSRESHALIQNDLRTLLSWRG